MITNRWLTLLAIPLVIVLSNRRLAHDLAVPVPGGVEVTPDGSALGVSAHATGWATSFWVKNTRTIQTTFSLSCASSGQVSCGEVEPSQVTLAPDQSLDVGVTFSSLNVAINNRIKLVASGGGAIDTGHYLVTVGNSIVRIVSPGADTVTSRVVVNNRQPVIRALFLLASGYATDTTATVLKWRDTVVTSLARHNRGLLEWEVDSARWLGIGDSAKITVQHTASGITTTETRWAVLLNDQKPILAFSGMALGSTGLGSPLPFGQGIAVNSGEIETGVTSVPYFSLGSARNTGLVYSSRTSYPRALVVADLELTWPVGTPDQIKIVLKDGTLGKDSLTLGTPTCATGATRRCRVTLQADYSSQVFATPTRKWLTVEARVTSSGVDRMALDSVEVVLVDRRTTPFGSGWWPQSALQLVGSNGQDRLLVGPNGGTTIFRGNGDSLYLAPPGSFSTLVKTGTGWELRTIGTNAKAVFNAQGRLVKATDANGNRDSIAYNVSGYPASITDPVDKTITYTYDANGNLERFTDPMGRQHRVWVNPTWRALTYDSVSSVPAKALVTKFWYKVYDSTSSTMVLTWRTIVFDTTSVQLDSVFKRRPVRVYLPRIRDESGNLVLPLISYTAAESRSVGTLRPLDSVYTEMKDPLNNWTRSLNNRWGQVYRTWDAIGQIRRTHYSADGYPLWTEGPVVDSSRIYNVYDQFRRIVKSYAVRANGDTVRGDSMVYDANHRVVKRVDSRGKVDSMAYDANGNTIYARDAAGNVTRMGYLADGRLDSVLAPFATKATKYIYETVLKQLSRIRNEGADTSQWIAYDQYGRDTTVDSRIKVTVSLTATAFQWRRIRRYYNITNALDSTTLLRTHNCTSGSCLTSPQWPPYVPGSGGYIDTTRIQRVRYYRDRAGRDSIRADDRNNKTRYQLDALGRLMRRWPWADSVLVRDSMVYDVAGNLRKTFTRRGIEIASYFDSRGRDTATVIPGVGTLRTVYGGPAGQVSRVTMAGYVDSIGGVNPNLSYSYDPFGRLKSDTSWSGTVARPTSYSYDTYERLSSMVDALGTWTMKYETDRGLPDTLITPMDDVIAYSYDSRGRVFGPTVSSSGTQFTVTPTYDHLSNLFSLTQTIGSSSYNVTTFQLSAADSADVGPALSAFWTEQSGPLGLVDSLRDSVAYDGWKRLTNWVAVTRPNGGSWTVTSGDTFGFDRTGNILTASGAQNYDLNTNRLLFRTVGPNRHYYYYDGAGNTDSVRVKRISDGALLTRWLYKWDALNRLIQVRRNDTLIARYGYDVVGRRIAKRNYLNPAGGYLRFVYHGDQVSFETDSLGTTIGHKYTWGLLGVDDLIAVRTGSTGSTHYYVAKDDLGSVRGLVRRGGTWTFFQRFDPYGESIASSGTDQGLRFKWTGREYDSETGLYFFRARYFEPGASRFIQEDPIGYDGGSNLYAYVDGSPLEERDPYGLTPGAGYRRDLDYWDKWYRENEWCNEACPVVGIRDGRDDRPFHDANNDGLDDLMALVNGVWAQQMDAFTQRLYHEANRKIDSVSDRAGKATKSSKPRYTAPDYYKHDKGHFWLDFTDQHGHLFTFKMTGVLFVKIRDLKSTSNGAHAIYTITSWDTATNSLGAQLGWANFIRIRSTLVEIGPNRYSGRFVQDGKFYGKVWHEGLDLD
jgi:RHS repeat-associated protein